MPAALRFADSTSVGAADPTSLGDEGDPVARIAARWQPAAPTPPVRADRLSADGVVDIDLVRDGPTG